MGIDRRQLMIAAGSGAAATWLKARGAPPLPAQAAAGGPVPTAGLEEQLAHYAAGVRYAELPHAVIEACKRALLDALACAFAAVATPPARITAATFRQAFGTGGAATVIGDPRPISTEGAVLVNGTLIRHLDLNDVYFGKDPSRPSEIIPAAIACCEEAGRGGRDLIEALVVGYEAEVRLNDAISWAAHGLIASSAAAFVTPLVAGKAWRMPVEQVIQAIGIAGPRQLTLLAVNSGEISMMKSVGPGYTVMDAVFSTRLAAAGLTGVTHSLEWLAANMPPRQALSIDLDLRHYRLTRVAMKRFPLQGELQAVAEAGVNLHAKLGGRARAIQEVSVQTYPGTLGRGVAEPEKFRPANRETADHSLPICLAIALLDGDVSVRQYAEGRWRAPDVLALAQKVKVSASPALMAQKPDGHGTIVDLRMEDGQVLREAVLVPEGDAARPMSGAAIERKFRQFADPVLGESAARQVVDAVTRLEQLEDVRTLTAQVRTLR